MRFRVFRSRAFWFGVPGLVFLLWGWWISMGHQTGAWFTRAFPSAIGQSAGEVFIFWHSNKWPDWRGFEVAHSEMSVEQACEWKTVLAAKREDPPSFRLFFIPYYWLVLGYLAVWAGIVFWRSRKYGVLPETE